MGAVNPFRMWRDLDGGAKLAVYTRLSLEAMVVFFGLYIVAVVAFTDNDANPPAWLTALDIVASLLLLVAGVAVLELRTEFTTAPRREMRRVVPWLLPTATVLGASCWVVGLLLMLSGSDGISDGGLPLIVVSLFIMPLAVMPWLPYHWPVTVVAAVVTAVVLGEMWWMSLFIPFFLMTTLLSAWTVNIAKQLDRARITESALQVSEERLRFAQELHDTLGQRLAAISVKTELARALAARGDDRLDAELAELQSLAQASVAEMHDVVEGYRTVNLSTEITGSRQLLESAGITLTVEGDPTALPEPLRETAAWLVREATTNVVKHADATWVRLTLTPDTVTVANDGVARDIERLSGLAGIRRRAEPSGASLVAERDGNLFTVTLRGAA
ncbi:sensor histidine kinase [Corynebacterium variabile]|uniref:Signal transduction histidine kinase n=1 Tax=Corynebacterium variabile TaxID=1727 RepID=A0A0X2NML7_9CORY|nr:histidine kinase [Corynebacterium variabile]MDN6239687.1 histidine kinase [Corynebacterium variabile]MDN6476661.1 histidine kinase [Corynebacterium variabile]MDN6535295.1 histidine kinase [Corynebacterium variabile]MDN6661022.1 histidine kinase [Corynebacterium variabile]MDN6676054.1 histidine kinase [Corynebacterium variabile]